MPSFHLRSEQARKSKGNATAVKAEEWRSRNSLAIPVAIALLQISIQSRAQSTPPDTEAPKQSAPPAAQAASAATEGEITQIVITAEKRSSTVQKTPASITAYSGEELKAAGITNMLNLAQETPGLSFRSAGPGQTEYEMRGLASSGGSTATVGFYFDDVPISPPALGGIGKITLDPNLYDLSRVEVLRGPQGTLYGSGSMGGTIKVITHPAVIDKFEGSGDATVSSTDGGGVNHAVNGMVNLPLLNDVAALRLVASSNYTAGWVDRLVVSPFPQPTNNGCAPTNFLGCARGDVSGAPVTQRFNHINWARSDTLRPNIQINPTDELSIAVTGMLQNTKTGGPNTFDSPPGQDSGTLAHYQPFNQPEPSSDVVRLLGVVATYDFSKATLTSSTSYWKRSLYQSQDQSEVMQNIYALPQFYPISTGENDNIRQFSQELRLSSSGKDPFQWIAGLYYSSLDYTWQQSLINVQLSDAVYGTGFYAPLTAADNPQGIVYLGNVGYKTKQSAAFGEVSYLFGEKTKLTVGGRYYNYDTNVLANQAGLFSQNVDATPSIVTAGTRASGANPKINLSYAASKDLNVYGTIAKGFRPGGINLPLPSAGPNDCTSSLATFGLSGANLSYKADSVLSYELGEKARIADGLFTINSAIYYIDWRNIQQSVPLACGYFSTINAGNARSYGADLEIRAKLSTSWTLAVSGGSTHAEINDPAPTAVSAFKPGSPILNIPKATASASALYETAFNETTRFTARAAMSYVGSEVDEAYTFVNLPAYTLYDLRLGLVSERWSAYLTGTNLDNKIVKLTANNTSLGSNMPGLTRFTSNQPRTIGLTASYKF